MENEEELEKIIKEVNTSPTDERDVVVDGINCRQIDYLSSLKYNNKNIKSQFL